MSPYIDFRAVAQASITSFPRSNFYFLLDHGGLPGLHRQLSCASTKWISLFDGTTEAEALDVAPILVLAATNGRVSLSNRIFDWIGQNGTYTSAVIMLSSPLLMEPLKKRLGVRLDVKLSGDFDAMLRYFDPRVLETLVKTLTAEQLVNFFSVAEAWQYVDRGGNIKNISSNFSNRDHFSHPLVLTPEQESILIDGSETDQVLGLLRAHVPQLLEKLPSSNKHERISKMVEASKNDGLTSTLQHTIYAAMALLNEEPFIVSDARECFLNGLRNNEIDNLEAFAN